MNISHLNPQQQHVIRSVDGPLLVLAGAGSGKTTVITHRIAWMLHHRIRPENILAVTFTNKAAKEMKERISKLTSSKIRRKLNVGTFHAFGCKILRFNIQHLGYSQKFGIADEGDQIGLIKQVAQDMDLGNQAHEISFLRSGISNAKNHLQSPEEVRDSSDLTWFKTLAVVYDRYQNMLQSMDLVDFDDLLYLPIRLWHDNEQILEKHRQQFQYILVDEYQDTNRVQAEMINLLAGIHLNICVVGDDDQSIYGWRGAEIKNILNFPDRFPGTQITKLEQNYRSTNTILNAANAVIKLNKDRHSKSLWSDAGRGESVKIITADNETHETKIVTDLLKNSRFETKNSYENMAILYRSNFQSRLFEISLRKAQIPYRLIGSRSFYERREIRDALAYLKIIHRGKDDLSLLRILNVPARGIGDKTVDKMKLYREQTGKHFLNFIDSPDFLNLLNESTQEKVKNFTTKYRYAVDQFNQNVNLADNIKKYFGNIGYLDGLKTIYKNTDDYESRFENVMELINSAVLLSQSSEGNISLQEFLESYSLAEDPARTEKDDKKENHGVTLMTIHAAKGTEFPVVIVVGLEQNLFPHERSLADQQIEEERRLFYVALTRAKTHLYLTRARSRVKYNTKSHTYPSQFISELPEDSIEFSTLNELFKPAEADDVDSILAQMRERFA